MYKMAVCIVATLLAAADPPADIRELKLRDWEPRSMMVTKTTVVEKPMFPVIDIHNHLGGGKQTAHAGARQALPGRDERGRGQTVVNLDGGWGDRLKETLAALDEAHPGRFLTFALVNFDGIDDADWGEREAKRLEESFQAGAKGLKFHKTVRPALPLQGRQARAGGRPEARPGLGDVRQAQAAGRDSHRRPGRVLHAARPLQRALARTQRATRTGSSSATQFPKREDLLDQLHRVIAKHPKTTFINTHFGNNAEDLARVAEKLDKYPNMYVDIDARISELGRQPYTARKFFLKYQDRIMFGTDTTPKPRGVPHLLPLPRNRRRVFRLLRPATTCKASGTSTASICRRTCWRRSTARTPSACSRPEAAVDRKAARAERQADRRLRESPATARNAAWKKAEWEPLHAAAETACRTRRRSRCCIRRRACTSLMEATDKKITATMQEGLREPVDGGRFEVFLWPDERRPALLRVRDLAARQGAADLGAESRRQVPRLAAVALRRRPQDPQGDLGHRRRR